MIDIHCHILPGLDDGALNLDESKALASQALEEGITTIIATPHHANGVYDNNADSVNASVELLNEALNEAQIPLKVIPGQEIRVYRELLDDFQSGKLLTLANSNYMLLEFPSHSIPEGAQDLIYELNLVGIIPIIAHPERNSEIANDPSKLARLIEAGALSQITSHSVIGLFGKKIQKVTFNLCKQNLTHFVASDAHNISKRPFNLNRAYQLLNSEFDSDLVDYFKQNAIDLLSNYDVHVKEAYKRSRKWYQFWQ